MQPRRHLFTSESVTEGHPDKICDQIADAVLDAILAADPYARVACEVAVTTGLVLVMGEITTECYVDIPRLARDVVREIGYDRAKYGFDADTCAVLTSLEEQSPDIAQGVNQAVEIRSGEQDEFSQTGAGDQGIVFGYAANETPELMPMPIVLAHRLARRLAEVRKQGIVPFLRPDGKTQVTVEYEGDTPVRVDTVIVSTQHHPDVAHEQITQAVMEHVIEPIIPERLRQNTKYLINPTGRFVIGGPQGDAGVTGRKIIVDTYGGMARHGGGAFSGKDPTKIDRSGSYAARWVAKNIVAAGLADRAEIQIAYAIGVARPVAVRVETFGTSKIPESDIEALVRKHFDLRPEAIIRNLGLRRPVYRQVAAYGHFGRPDLDLPWEQLDKVEVLRQALEASKA